VIETSIQTGSHANCSAHFQSLLRSSIIYAYCTNVVQGLIKLIACNDVPGSVEEWHISGKTTSKRVHYQSQIWTIEQLSTLHRTVFLATFLGSRYVIACHQFHQAFPRVSIASDKHWGEKTWVRGKVSISFSVACSICPYK